MHNHYFAEDGNYGSTVGMVIVDTSTWTAEDWDEIEGEFDWDKPAKALEIMNRVKRMGE